MSAVAHTTASFLAAAADQVVAELCRRSLHAFLRHVAWPAMTPRVPFSDNWHIGAVCEHLEAVKSGQIKKLIINIPFRCLKSTIVSQAFPAWDWVDDPQLQYMTASYAKDVATRDAVNARRIIESPQYRRFWGSRYYLTTDQNVKTRYENSEGGSRVITSTDAAGTGFGGHRRIVDDPLSAKQADSELKVLESVEWWKGSFATRANDPAGTDSVIVVHQRLSPRDLTGHCLAEESGWEHLVLPMRYEAEHTKTTSLGFVDPRREEGELLHPARLPEAEVADLERTLGSYHAKAQLQQRPESREGQIFPRGLYRFWREAPQCEEVVLSVDCTFKDLKSSDFVAIHVWGRRGPDKYLLYRKKDRLGFGATCVAVRAVQALFPACNAVLVEDKANGSAVIETLQKEIAGVLPIEPEGGKVARAYAVQPQHEAGNIYLPDPSVDPEVEKFLSESDAFPGGANDDEVDAMTQALNWMRNRQTATGMLDYYKAMAEEGKRRQ